MRLVLFHAFGVPIGSHNFFIALGVLCAAVVFIAECRRRGQVSEEMVWIAGGALIGGAIGAKLSALFADASTSPERIAQVIVHGGRSIIGGLTGGYAGVEITKRIVRYRWSTGDNFAPAAALGCAIGRIGCFLTEMPGTPTTLPWGIRLTQLQAAMTPRCPSYCLTSALHPSFIYESIFQLLMFVLLWTKLRWDARLEGELIKIYLLCYAVFRFLVEFIRGNDVAWYGLTRHQLFLIPAIVVLTAYLARRFARRPGSRSAPTLSQDFA